ncbi:MAG: AAA family ATPase, partial [Promethearchaeota archaeon]
MRKTTQISGISLILSSPDEIPDLQWIGEELYLSQLLAAWTIVDPKHDIPMNPQILGKPGVGKTTLAYSTARSLGLPVYIFQCTVDTRPEDLLITPVIGKNNNIEYHASPLVSAMIEGGVCILDEANRMAEKSWASLAPLLDQRRYVESIIAGIKIPAHPNFRICVTMNEDSSTFEVPEYIHSRLQPQIFIEFPDSEEEFQILKFNLPFASDQIIEYTVRFLQKAHKANKNYTVRDGINICRYYLKIQHHFFSKSDNPNSVSAEYASLDQSSAEQRQNNATDPKKINKRLFQQSLFHILGEEGYKFYLGKENSTANHSGQF